MRKEYFVELGEYDMGMEIWGSENIELSLKVSHAPLNYVEARLRPTYRGLFWKPEIVGRVRHLAALNRA